MQNFLVILSDNDGNVDWKHPSELNGASKHEVYNLIAQDVPAQNIIDVLTEEEYEERYIKKSGKGTVNKNVQQDLSNVSSDQFANGKDFFNAMLEAGTSIGETNAKETKNSNKKSKNNKHNSQDETIIVNNTNIEPENVRYFEEGGIRFKLENGKLYKKVWKQILLNGQKTPDGNEAVSEFRLVSATTKKLVSVEKLELQRLDWEEVKTH